jgi:hypothetical protein
VLAAFTSNVTKYVSGSLHSARGESHARSTPTNAPLRRCWPDVSRLFGGFATHVRAPWRAAGFASGGLDLEAVGVGAEGFGFCGEGEEGFLHLVDPLFVGARVGCEFFEEPD